MRNRSRIICLMIMWMWCAIEGTTLHTVGDSAGWSLTADYGTWATTKTFSLGDSLVFNYPPGHTVDEVSAADYKSCTVGNAIASDSSGATTVLLKTAGPHYYICGVPGHCAGGMKLAINVVPGGGGPTTASPATPTGVTTLPPPTGIASLPPPTGLGIPAGGTFTDPYSSSARLSPAAAAAVIGFYVVAVFV